MERIVIPFTTEEDWLANRIHDLTSSDIPCLFGVGYQTYADLFRHKLNGTAPKFEPTEEVLWGKAFEPVIAQEMARRNGWNIRRKDEYIRIPELRLASSFDYCIEDIENDTPIKLQPGRVYPYPYHREVALMEVKNVNSFKYKKDWREGFDIESTPYIEIQVQNELLVSQLPVCYICVCVGGFRGLTLRRIANPNIQNAILAKSKQFWQAIDQARR